MIKGAGWKVGGRRLGRKGSQRGNPFRYNWIGKRTWILHIPLSLFSEDQQFICKATYTPSSSTSDAPNSTNAGLCWRGRIYQTNHIRPNIILLLSPPADTKKNCGEKIGFAWRGRTKQKMSQYHEDGIDGVPYSPLIFREGVLVLF